MNKKKMFAVLKEELNNSLKEIKEKTHKNWKKSTKLKKTKKNQSSI